MVCLDTLRIKNLPKELTDPQKEDFIRHFGASNIKVITSRLKEKSVVYAKFDSNEIAKTVLLRLHQKPILNARLSIEYAENDILAGKTKLKKIEETDDNSKNYFKTFVTKLNSFNDAVGFHQPPPSHLKYKYPKANRGTINNIAHALATIPRFYTQVLHLMNRMNLPPPFAVPDVPTRASKVPYAPSALPTQTPESSSESELESDEETSDKNNKEIIPQKRLLPQKKNAVKRPKFIKPQAAQQPSGSKSFKPENVFDIVDVQPERKIEMKVSCENLDAPNSEELEAPAENEVDEEVIIKSDVITSDELAANQIALKDLGVLPVFKNYHPGVPTCRLYIKNCAKNVTLEDLQRIYNRYKLEPEEGTIDPFEIKLMQEGRMKGQAFVTLANLELAQKAVKETNAYILKDKPLVVVYSKSPAVTKEKKS